MDDAEMVKATGKALDEWCALLDERGAASLAVETSTLDGRPAIDRWKAFWKAYLALM